MVEGAVELVSRKIRVPNNLEEGEEVGEEILQRQSLVFIFKLFQVNSSFFFSKIQVQVVVLNLATLIFKFEFLVFFVFSSSSSS